MRNLKIVASMFLLGLLISAGIQYAKADSGNWDTIVTFSAPVEVPGMALAAGRYEFRLLDTTGPEYTVAILNSKGQFLEAVQGIPTYRENITDNTVMKLQKGARGTPEELKAWFYPDENYGVSFLYPNEKPAKAR